jgi:DNA helicase-2/ATP-dependent DNA helicase PcrA
MPSNKNQIIVASAGSRKTTSIVEQALSLPGQLILVTTYTNENLAHLRSEFVKRAGVVPTNVLLMTWFSFLLQETVRPYQNFLVDPGRVRTVHFEQKEAPRPGDRHRPIIRYYPKTDPRHYYLTSSLDIYSDRVAEFAVHCDDTSGGMVVARLTKMLDHIFIDEMQDLTCYDLELLEKLFRSRIAVTAVGDPRQATLMTSRGAKNKKYRRGGITEWIDGKEKTGLVQVEHRIECWRSNQTICSFADRLYPDLPKSISRNTELTEHDGVFAITTEDAQGYFKKYEPLVLRFWKKTNTLGLPACNIKTMKGSTADRVLVFPTTGMRKFLLTFDPSQAGDVATLYVAITRARYSVAFVVDAKDCSKIQKTGGCIFLGSS